MYNPVRGLGVWGRAAPRPQPSVKSEIPKTSDAGGSSFQKGPSYARTTAEGRAPNALLHAPAGSPGRVPLYLTGYPGLSDLGRRPDACGDLAEFDRVGYAAASYIRGIEQLSADAP